MHESILEDNNYAVSNAGSLLALAYPIVLEPSLRLPTQSLLWTSGYGALVLVATWRGISTWNVAPGTAWRSTVSATSKR